MRRCSAPRTLSSSVCPPPPSSPSRAACGSAPPSLTRPPSPPGRRSTGAASPPPPATGPAFYRPGDRLRLDTHAGAYCGDFEGLDAPNGWQLARVTRPDADKPYVVRMHVPCGEVRASGVSPPKTFTRIPRTASHPRHRIPPSLRSGPADDAAPCTPSEALRVGAFLGDRLRVRPPANEREVVAIAARALWLEPAPGPRGRPNEGGSGGGGGPGAPPSGTPDADGVRVARFLLAHVPARRGAIRRINHTAHLRILRPLLDPRYRTFHGDALDALDFCPMRRAPPSGGAYDATYYADGVWLDTLQRVARGTAKKGGHRSLLGQPLPLAAGTAPSDPR